MTSSPVTLWSLEAFLYLRFADQNFVNISSPSTFFFYMSKETKSEKFLRIHNIPVVFTTRAY